MNIKNTWITNSKIAHRGLHNDANPENTLAAFELAILHGYAIELDVRELSDGTIVVFHDETLDRLTKLDGYVCKQNWDTIKNLTIGKSEHTIPTLQQMLNFVGNRAPLLIEIKNENFCGSFEKNILDILKNYTGEYAVQSFNPYSLEVFKNMNPTIIRGQLATQLGKDTKMEKSNIKQMNTLKVCDISEPHFLSYDIQFMPNKYIRKQMKNGLPIIGWVVRSQEEYEKAKGYCDNIIFEGFCP